MFVADEIPPELQRVVEFLNNQMGPAKVLAVEIPRYAGGGLETFAPPGVIGQTVAARTKKAGSSRGQRWDEPRFLAQVQRAPWKGALSLRVRTPPGNCRSSR